MVARSGNGARYSKKGGSYLRQKKLARYQFVDGEKTNYPGTILCRAMQVQRSAYYLFRDGKFCYLACLQDKFTRRIVGWLVSKPMTAQLVIDVFLQGRRRGLIGKGAIIHTDQGSQYAAVEYRRLQYINGFRQSMSRKGNCYDNAQAESFFSRFKAKFVENGIFESVQEARSEVFSYIEGYYNRIRLHSGLGYKSPIRFENELKIKQRSESFVSRKT